MPDGRSLTDHFHLELGSAGKDLEKKPVGMVFSLRIERLARGDEADTPPKGS
jgi:hypothetical protein